MKFTNPFDANPVETNKLTAVVPIEAFRRVKRVRLEQGTVATTLQLLWHKLILALDERNITEFSDSKRFEHFVATCRLTDGGSPAESRGETPPSDVRGGTPGTPGPVADSPHGTAELPRVDRRKQKPSNGGKQNA